MTESSAPEIAPRSRRRWLWLAAVPVCLWLLANGLLQVPAAQRPVREKLAAAFGQDFRWSMLWWNPFSGVVMEGFEVTGPEAGGQVSGLRVRRVVVEPDYRSLLSGKPKARGLVVRGAKLTVVRLPDGRMLVPGKPPPPEAAESMVTAKSTAPPAGRGLPGESAATSGPAQSTGTALAAAPEEAVAQEAPGAKRVPRAREPAGAAASAPTAMRVPPPPATGEGGPAPDIQVSVTGGELDVVEAGSGRVVALVRGAALRLDKSGGEIHVDRIGHGWGGEWLETRAHVPVRWRGPVAEMVLAERHEAGAELAATVQVAAAPGLPCLFQMAARNAPVSWFAVPAALAGQVFPVQGNVNGEIKAIMMLARPASRAGIMAIEARDLTFGATRPGHMEELEGWVRRPGEAAGNGVIGIGRLQVQAQWQDARAVVPVLQVDAAGALAACQLEVGPGGALGGQATVLLGAEGEERVAKFEERLPHARRLGFTGTTEVRFPDGSTARWKSRVLRIGGTVRQPLVALWQDLGFLGLADTLAVLRASLLPEDPNAVDLIPLGRPRRNLPPGP